MGKATRIKQQNARERIAAQRAAAKRAERRRRILLTGGSILGVVAIVVALVVIKLVSSGKTTAGPVTGTALPASVVRQITSVPATHPAGSRQGDHDSQDPHPDHRRAADLGRQTRGAVHRGRVLPVLRGRAVGDGGGAEQVRHLLRPARHSFQQYRRLPEHTNPDLLQEQLHEQVPDLHAGRDHHREQEHAAAEDDGRSAGAAEQIRRAPVRLLAERWLDPVHRLQQQIPDQWGELQPAGAAGQDLEPGRGRTVQSGVPDHPGGRGCRQHDHRRALQAHQQPPATACTPAIQALEGQL